MSLANWMRLNSSFVRTLNAFLSIADSAMAYRDEIYFEYDVYVYTKYSP